MAKKAAKSRHGMVKKGKKDEPAKFVPGRAAVPKDFDPAKVAEEMCLWWENDGGDNYMIQNGSLWSKWPMKAIVNELKAHPDYWIRVSLADGERISEADRVLQYVRKERCVEEVIPALAGYKPGVQHLPDGRRIIVRLGATLIKPEQKPFPTVKAMIENLLDLSKDGAGGIDQTPWFHAWHQVAYRSLAFGEPGSYKPGHLLVIAGTAGNGKSRLQVNITTPILGYRVADPTPYLNGEDIFNGDIAGSEHLMMEELLSQSQRSVDRAQLGEAFKRLIVNTSRRMRLMKTDPITVNPFTRVTLTMNNDQDTLRAFPLLTPTFRGKVLMLQSSNRGLPMPTETAEQQKEFNRQIAEELPGYVWWLLNEYQIPDDLKVDDEHEKWARFGFSYFQHPDLSEALFDDTPAAKLLHLIDAAKIVTSPAMPVGRGIWDLPAHPKGLWNEYDHEARVAWGKKMGKPIMSDPVWEGSAEMLTDILIGERTDEMGSNVERAAKALLRHGEFDRLLGRLASEMPERVSHERTGPRGRFWRIRRAYPGGAGASASAGGSVKGSVSEGGEQDVSPSVHNADAGEEDGQEG